MARRLHREDIRAALRKQFGTLVNFERAQGLPKDAVTDLLRGRSSNRTAAAVAEALGTSVSKIVGADRAPRESSGLPDDTAGAPGAHRLSSTVR